jgi:hypothetical protein
MKYLSETSGSFWTTCHYNQKDRIPHGHPGENFKFNLHKVCNATGSCVREYLEEGRNIHKYPAAKTYGRV